MFELYSDTEEPQQLPRDLYARRRNYSKNNKAKKMVINKYNELSLSDQRSYWDDLSISIETAVSKLNPGNIRTTSTKLIKLNIMRGKGLLCRSIMESQSQSPNFTHIYATLVSFINNDFPNVAELLLVRCICVFADAYKCKDENKYVPPVLFIAHLVQNNVARDCRLVLEIIQTLIKTPNLHSIGLVDDILKVCGEKLNSNPQNDLDLKYTFDKLQNISQDDHIDESVQCLARTILLAYQKHFEDDQQLLVDPHKQYVNFSILDQHFDPQYELDNFVYDLDFKATEIIYKQFSREILKSKSKRCYFSIYDLDEMADDEDECETETNMLILSNRLAKKKIICMMVNSNLLPSQIALELMAIKMKPGQEIVLCMEYMECCFENSAVYNKHFADIIQSCCALNPLMVGSLELIFRLIVNVVDQGQIISLKNLAKLFAQLLSSNSISWNIFSSVHLAEIGNSYRGKTYFTELFKSLILLMGRDAVKERLLDPSLQQSFAGLFPLNDGVYHNYLYCHFFFAEIDLYDVIVPFQESLIRGVPV
ncbi:pre-mRNA-splicing factor CWC22 homolog [Metopolophium dirhodum]|uniref:pre-mRNA-splicing factor CWC22 homolog n=1 Tax=Metopolophium dirhodum TaxID=44670 RepID=UPI00298F6335|nr:pre-mRNA-splicing factor CWC22 homolog [Metopolophium dirhodum]